MEPNKYSEIYFRIKDKTDSKPTKFDKTYISFTVWNKKEKLVTDRLLKLFESINVKDIVTVEVLHQFGDMNPLTIDHSSVQWMIDGQNEYGRTLLSIADPSFYKYQQLTKCY